MASDPTYLSEENTCELVRRLQDGESSAWEELYNSYRDELLFYVRARMGKQLRSALASEDVLQSVALEAFQALPGFEVRGSGSLRRFLHTLVLNKLRDRADALSAAKRAGTVALATTNAAELCSTPPEDLSYTDPSFERLERALQGLPDPMREVLLLRRVEGRSSQEVARLLGKSDDAVRKLYSRALAHLSLRLDPPSGAQV